MIALIEKMLSYSLITNALFVGIIVSLCAALLGVSLVLKRFSMIGDGLSHVGFGALSVAMVLNLAPLWVAVPAVVLAAFLLLRAGESSRIKGDAAIGLISCSALALGVFLTSLFGGQNADVYSFMFGSILTVTRTDIALTAVLGIAVISVFVVCYNRIFTVTFDPAFAKATGTHVSLLNHILAFLAAITIVIGMRIMGTLLISGLLLFPALTSMSLFRSFFRVTLCSALISVGCFIAGMTASYAINTPVGATIILCHLIAFTIFYFAAKLRRIS